MIFTRLKRLRFNSISPAFFLCLIALIAGTSEAGVIHVPDKYKTIQEAVNSASSGDTIIVNEGEYKENVAISKPLTIRSNKGPEATVVHAAIPGRPVFEVKNAKGVEVAGFAATGSLIAGFHIDASENVLLNDNRAEGNGSGIILSSSSNNTLTNNTASSNKQYGIYLKSSDRNMLDNNKVRSNMDTGIFLSSSSYNSLTGNTANLNKWNGILLWSSNDNRLEGNRVLRNMFAIVISDSRDNALADNSTWPNIYIILPIVLIYIGIMLYLIQRSFFRFIYKVGV